MESGFHVLDIDLTLSGPDEIVGPITSAYRRFLATAPGDRSSPGVRLDCTSPESLIVDGMPVPLVEEIDPTLQVYQRFLNTILDRVEHCAVLHASALLDSAGGAVVLAAPAGHGKTSLTLELVGRGYRFLSDDYAPLDLTTGNVRPYPRAVGILPGGRAPIPAAFSEAARRTDAPRLLGKALVDVGQVLGEDAMATGLAPLRHVILLAGADEREGPATTELELTCLRERAEEIESEIAAIDGVETVARHKGKRLWYWRLRLRHDLYPTERLSRVLDDDAVIFTQKYWAAPPDFEAVPRALPVKRREAAELLTRELLNRRGGSRLLRRYPGGLMELLLDIGSCLAGAQCWKVCPGKYRGTADLIRQIVGDGK